MKIKLQRLRGNLAFSLIEAFIGVLIAAVVVGSLFAGLSAGFREIATIREELRAGQIIVEKFETIRLYSWHQLNNSGFVPASFTSSFIPDEGTNITSKTYRGTVTVTNAPNTLPYSEHMKLVTIDLVWDAQSGPRTNSMSTLVSRYGIQNYTY